MRLQSLEGALEHGGLQVLILMRWWTAPGFTLRRAGVPQCMLLLTEFAS